MRAPSTLATLALALAATGCAPALAAAPSAAPRPNQGVVAPHGTAIRQATPAEAAAFLAANPRATFLDVREPDEYAAGHARGAVLRPLGALGTWAGSLKATEPVVLICRSGSRSGKAAAALEARGFKTLVNVAGGTLAWEADALPMER